MNALINAADQAHAFRLHPLGFFYLKEDVAEGLAQRIHIWLPCCPDRPENSCHQHSYDIESLVVVGRMRSDIFSFKAEKCGPDVEFAVSYDAKNSIQSPSGRKGRLLPIASFETVAGASYRLEAGAIHRVEVVEKPCITLVHARERHIPIFTYGQDDEVAFERRLCSEREAEKIRDQLLVAANPGKA